MHLLSPLDYGIILGYLLVLVAVGVLMTRRASASMEQYFLGGRALPWYLLGAFAMTSWFDLAGTTLITSFLYLLGPRGLFIEFRGGAVLALAFALVFTGKWHRRSGCMTGAEWNIYRFGNSRASEWMRRLGAVMVVINTVMLIGLLVRGSTLFMGIFFPFPPYYTVIGLTLTATAYAVVSGLHGIAATALLQSGAIVLSALIITVLAWSRVSESGDLAAIAERVTGNPEWTQSLPGWHTPLPPGYESYSSVLLLAGFYLLRQCVGGLGSGAEARHFGARSDRECGLQSLQAGLLIMLRWPMMIGFAVLGLYHVAGQFPDLTRVQAAADQVATHYPQSGAASWHDLTADIATHPAEHPPELIANLELALGPNWPRKLPLVGRNGQINPEQILPVVLHQVVPDGLRGLVLVTLLAAMMTSLNGLVNGAGAFAVKDLYQNFLRPDASNRELLTASYITGLAVVAAGLAVGLAAASINHLWSWIMMSLLAGQLAPTVLRLYWWRCNAWGCLWGMLLGTAGALGQRCLAPDLSEPDQFLLACGLSFAGTIAGSLFSAPTPRPVLDNFYLTTRPFGLWGPLRKELSEAARWAIDRENRQDIIALPFALLWQVTLFLLPMQLVIRAYTSFWLTLPLFLLGMIGLYFYWWLPLREREAGLPLPHQAPS